MDTSDTVCPKCTRKYSISTIRPLKGCIPLSLPCKHNMCDICIYCKLKIGEDIKCPLCERLVDLSEEQKKHLAFDDNLYKEFPVHICVLGQLTLQLSKDNAKDNSRPVHPYINLKKIIDKTGRVSKSCSECKLPTCYNCDTCRQTYCDACFVKVHGAFESLKAHVKSEIEFEKKSSCAVHPTQEADFYCDTCSKPVCMSCLVVGAKECASHKIENFHDRNLANLEKFKEVKNTADEIFRRLTKTAVDVGNKLDVILNEENEPGDVNALAAAVRQHYAKLHACLQQQEQEQLALVRAMGETDRLSLERAKTTLAQSLAAVYGITKKLDYFVNNVNVKVNVMDLVSEMQTTLDNTAWFLQKKDLPEETPSMKLDTSIFQLLEEHLTISADGHAGYALLPTKDVTGELPPAPARPVFPPEPIVLDVREKDKMAQSEKIAPAAAPKVPEIPAPKPAEKRQKKNLDYVPLTRRTNSQTSSFTYGSQTSLNSNDSGAATAPVHHNPMTRPMKEEPQPIALKEGLTDTVCVAHINDPSDFFVHRASQMNTLRQLKADFQHASNYQHPRHGNVLQGNLYLSFCRTSSRFQRCRVLNIGRDNSNTLTYFVFYIDFGLTEWVTISELRQLPLPYTLQPALALHCQLHNVRPVSPQWHPDDVKLVHRIVSNKKAHMVVRRILGNTMFGLGLEVDLMTLDDGVNLAQALVYHEQACFINPELKYEYASKEKPPQLFNNPDMPKNSQEEVVVVCVVSPDRFFVRKHYLEQQFEQLQNNLHMTYGDIRRNHSGFVFCPEVGMTVACFVQLDEEPRGEWRRGVVTALAPKRRVKVYLPDSGHELMLLSNNLRRLQQRFFETKMLAFECHLSHVSPFGKYWSPQSVHALNRYLHQKLLLIVDDMKKRSLGVRLYDESDPQNVVCINEEFVRNKLGINIGTLSFAMPKQPQDSIVKAHLPEKPKTVQLAKAPEKRVLKRGQTEAEMDLDLQSSIDRGIVRVEVKILSCQTPSQLYVTIVQVRDSLVELFTTLNEVYHSEPPPPKQNDWKPDEKCAAYDKKAREWKRASIISVEDDRARVFCTDFAEVEDVPTSQLLPLLPQFQQPSPGAFKCHLRGITPAGGAEWPRISCECLNDLIDQYKQFFITKKGAVKNKSMPVELWVYHMTPGGALEPRKGEWRLLNQVLVDRGLALPDKELTEDLPDDTLSLLASTGTVTEQLEQQQAAAAQQQPTESVSEILQQQNQRSKPVASDAEEESADDSIQRVRTSAPDWKLAEPLASQEFECIPTFVNNDGIIYLHEAGDHHILNQVVRAALNCRYQSNVQEPVATEWRPKDPCVALYSLDDSFYRGRVLHVYETSCCVEFVDYGNVEDIATENMRREVITSDTPILARRCRFAGITLVGGKMREHAVEFAHRAVCERLCTARVISEQDGVYNIELRLKGQSINRLLVEMQFATDDNEIPMQDDSIVDDSNADFIVEDESESLASTDLLMSQDWVAICDQEKTEGRLRYAEYEIPADEEGRFKCEIDFVDRVDRLYLLPTQRDDEHEAKYAAVIDHIQKVGEEQPALEEVCPNKPCIALFGDDGKWYRACVIQQDKELDSVAVFYIDFGNMAVVRTRDARESRSEWCAVPPRGLAVRLPLAETSLDAVPAITATYERLIAANGELTAKVIAREHSDVCVELYTPDGRLIYQDLIDDGLVVLK